MVDFNFAERLTTKIAKIGQESSPEPTLPKIKPFQDYIDNKGNILTEKLNLMDGKWSRREILSRYFLLKVVLDQGPDPKGISLLMTYVLNDLYQENIPLFHRPIEFFRNIGKVFETFKKQHAKVREKRAEKWAKQNDSTAKKYNLVFGQTPVGMTSIKQVLQFLISRWGTPLGSFLMLEDRNERLVDFLEQWESAERMSKKLKSHSVYGLGRMIGNKACHLFAKIYVHSPKLVTDESQKSKGWSPYSYENPFDSNVGRVLFRTGWLQAWKPLKFYDNENVIQRGEGKGGNHYIRVTNIRRCNKLEKANFPHRFLKNYNEIVTAHLQTKTSRWRKVAIQQIPNALLLNTDLGIGDFDDGAMYIGTEFCKNHDDPNCETCPIKNLCKGYTQHEEWIKNYRT